MGEYKGDILDPSGNLKLVGITVKLEEKGNMGLFCFYWLFHI